VEEPLDPRAFAVELLACVEDTEQVDQAEGVAALGEGVVVGPADAFGLREGDPAPRLAEPPVESTDVLDDQLERAVVGRRRRGFWAVRRQARGAPAAACETLTEEPPHSQKR
jgi:hypothetical protein